MTVSASSAGSDGGGHDLSAATSSRRISSADWKRCAGALASARRMTSTRRGLRPFVSERELVALHRVQEFQERAPLERPLARDHLGSDDADGEEVAALVNLAARQLLGRHVAERAHHDAGRRNGLRLRHAGADVFGEPEVEKATASA
jgi:hypothetical protein